ncbi:MAG: hypothetical protein DWC10_06560 [Candidatus Poseidoniales archaeon]|nr:MAG: hypothetical protein DWC10_06560 [Candidatus Poseidoniales archaeon]
MSTPNASLPFDGIFFDHFATIHTMKELGHCPRCNHTEITVFPAVGHRREVCANCGFVDTYTAYKSGNSMLVLALVLGVVMAAVVAFFVVMN